MTESEFQILRDELRAMRSELSDTRQELGATRQEVRELRQAYETSEQANATTQDSLASLTTEVKGLSRVVDANLEKSNENGRVISQMQITQNRMFDKVFEDHQRDTEPCPRGYVDDDNPTNPGN